MTKQEFQERYHAFRTHDAQQAQDAYYEVNAEGIEGDFAVVVNFDHLGYGLMLNSAAIMIFRLDPRLAELNGFHER